MKKCKLHAWRDTPLTAKNGRKYSKCMVCGAVDYSAKLVSEYHHEPVKPEDIIMLPKMHESPPVTQLSMVDKHTGVPFAYNSEDGSKYYKTPRRKHNSPVVQYTGLMV